MAVQSSFYIPDGSTRTFPSTKHIASRQHAGVYLQQSSNDVWIIANTSLYELVNNAIVFDVAVDNIIYKKIEIRVADTADELEDSPSDIALVAGSIANVNTVAGSIINVNNVGSSINAVNNVSANTDNVNIVAGNIANVNAVGTNILDVNAVVDNMSDVNTIADNVVDVNTVASNITDVNIVSAAIQGGGSTPTDGGQFYGEGLIRGIQYMAKSIGDSNIVISSDVNAFAIDNIAVGSGGSITVEDGAIFKVL